MAKAERPMSGKQDAFIRSLLQDRELEQELKDVILAQLDGRVGDVDVQVSMKTARLMIKMLLEQPRVAPSAENGLPDVPEGRYAVIEQDVIVLLRVDRPTEGKWAGWTFVRESPGGLIRGPRRDALLGAIESDIEGAAAMYEAERKARGLLRRELRKRERAR